MTKMRHILLVEDNLLDVQLTEEAFTEVSKNSKLHVVRDGKSALDYLFALEGYSDRHLFPLPELVLLDLKMPDIDGLEVLHRIKADSQLKSIPVVILTSSKERQDIASCYESGANSYLVKPVSFNDFVELVRHIDQYWLSCNVTLRELEAKG